MAQTHHGAAAPDHHDTIPRGCVEPWRRLRVRRQDSDPTAASERGNCTVILASPSCSPRRAARFWRRWDLELMTGVNGRDRSERNSGSAARTPVRGPRPLWSETQSETATVRLQSNARVAVLASHRPFRKVTTRIITQQLAHADIPDGANQNVDAHHTRETQGFGPGTAPAWES